MPDLQDELKVLAQGCRRGFETLAAAQGSKYDKFPAAGCGDSAEIVGRIVHELLGLEGIYVCGTHHPSLPPYQTHAWFEAGGFILDLTHDQFAGARLTGWVFPLDNAWHHQFSGQKRRNGYYTEKNWDCYPREAYRAVLTSLLNTCEAEITRST